MAFNEAALLDVSLCAYLYSGWTCINFIYGNPGVYIDLGELEGVFFPLGWSCSTFLCCEHVVYQPVFCMLTGEEMHLNVL